MSTDMYVRGYRDLDGLFQDMIEVKRACDKAGLAYPQGLHDYFGGDLCRFDEEEDLRKEMARIDLTACVTAGDYGSEYDIEVAKIPAECKIIRIEWG